MAINNMSFDKEKFTFVTASKDKTAKLFDTKTLKVLKNYDTGRPVNAACVSFCHTYRCIIVVLTYIDIANKGTCYTRRRTNR